MKAVLEGTYAGSGGKQAICIKGDLSVEGFNVAAILEKLCELEGKLVSLQETVSRLQEQCMHSSVSQLAKALETIKEEKPASPEPVEVSTTTEASSTTEQVAKSVSKKK